jgi:hypothetical protein
LRKEGVFMFRKLVLGFMAAGAIVATAASNSYRVHIPEDSVIAGKSVKAGDYKIEIQNDTAVFKQGKQTIEVPASTQSVESKFAHTEIESTNDTIQEIHVGGSRTKIVFGGANATAGGGGQ